MRCGTGWATGMVMRGETIKFLEDAATLIEATEMVDPKQNVHHQSGTMADQLKLAVQTIETEFSAPDGVVMTADDVSEVMQALSAIKVVIDRVETKLAGYSAKHQEKPRSH